MSNPFNATFQMSHYGGAGLGTGSINFTEYPSNTIEDAAIDQGIFPSHGISTAILGYLSAIWNRVAGNHVGFVVPARVQDSGFVTSAGAGPTPEIVGVRLDLRTPVPVDIDMIFGKVPQMYLGMCGFGAVQAVSGGIGFGGFQIGGGAVLGRPRMGETIFINHVGNRYLPQRDPTANMFWWHLKPGVIGTVEMFLMDILNCGARCFTSTSDPLNQCWNPEMEDPLFFGDVGLDGQPK